MTGSTLSLSLSPFLELHDKSGAIATRAQTGAVDTSETMSKPEE